MESNLSISRPLFRRKLYISNSPYYLERSQEDGEKDLVRLAKKARREDGWTFYEDTKRWLHLTNGHSEMEEKGIRNMEVSCTLIEGPCVLGSDPTHYHLHPDYMIENDIEDLGEHAYVIGSLPSPGDIRAALSIPDYKWKIATSRGITTYEPFSEEASEIKWSSLLGSKLKEDQLVLEQEGFAKGLEIMLERLNKETEGILRLSYKPMN